MLPSREYIFIGVMIFFIILTIIAVIVAIVLGLFFSRARKSPVADIMQRTHAFFAPPSPSVIPRTLPAYGGYSTGKNWGQVAWAMMVVAQNKMYDVSRGNTTSNYDNLIYRQGGSSPTTDSAFVCSHASEYYSIWIGTDEDTDLPIQFVVFGGTNNSASLNAEINSTTYTTQFYNSAAVKTELLDRYDSIRDAIPTSTKTIVIGWDSGCTLALLYLNSMGNSEVRAYLYGFGQGMNFPPIIPGADISWYQEYNDLYCGSGPFFRGAAPANEVNILHNSTNINANHDLAAYLPSN